MRKEILNALVKHAEGHIEKHRANVLVYMERPVGIGDHPDVLEAIEGELEVMAKYHDQLEMLKLYLSN